RRTSAKTGWTRFGNARNTTAASVWRINTMVPTPAIGSAAVKDMNGIPLAPASFGALGVRSVLTSAAVSALN
ncbi:hypothetical protein ACQCQZ_26235, partial [Ralstonia pseudosolanacearum]|uniref:hypothetical protein n=1 Tax=Ralstonia pseudosolanacearum TaxID=1310165 RepID=UPI003CF9A8A8